MNLGYFSAIFRDHTYFSALNPATLWGITRKASSALTLMMRLSSQRGWLFIRV